MALCVLVVEPGIGRQLGYGLRPDVTVVSPGNQRPGDAQRLPDMIQSGAPLVAARLAPGVFKGLVPNPLGPLWLYQRTPACVIGPWKGGKPKIVWPGFEMSFFLSQPAAVERGGVLTLRYIWHHPVRGPRYDALEAVVIFVDDKGQYPEAGGALWFHDTHECLNGWFRPGDLDPKKFYAYERMLFVPSNFPPGRYRILVALQKPGQISNG